MLGDMVYSHNNEFKEKDEVFEPVETRLLRIIKGKQGKLAVKAKEGGSRRGGREGQGKTRERTKRNEGQEMVAGKELAKISCFRWLPNVN